MNIYALFPLFATIAFIPLLVTTIATRPRNRQHTLFILFLIPATLWSLFDFFFRSNFFPEQSMLLLRLGIIMYTWMAVQFHCFSSSFYSPGEGRWLPVAVVAMIAVTVMSALGYFPEGVDISGDKLYPRYGVGFVFIAVPLFILLGRNAYVLIRKLKNLDNPVLYNQIISLLLGLGVLMVFTLAALLPFGREFPVSHVGNIFNALILSYATIRHQLLDIKIVLRRGLALIGLGAIGIAGYLGILVAFHAWLGLEIFSTTTLVVGLLALAVSLAIFKLRSILFRTVSKALEGESFDYREKLSRYAANIHKIFSLKEQGGELLCLIIKAINCRKAALLFLEPGGEDFVASLAEPGGEDNPLSGFKLVGHNPIVEYLRREHQPLTRVNLEVLPELRGLWTQEREEIKANNIEVFIPLVSRGQLVGILVLDRKQSGRYTLQDFSLLEEVTNRAAVSMEKEYIREQLRERERELSLINRSSSIITSSLDIRRTYDSFVNELKKVVDVSWAAVTLIEDGEIYLLALSSEIGSEWQPGERLPIKDTATEWVASHKKALIEPDLKQESRFTTGKNHLQHGVRSVAYLPLMVGEEVIGSFIIASCNAYAYSQRHLKLLEEVAAQIAMSVENSRLFAKAEQKARIDGLTGLLNRRSLDELISSEINRHSRYGGIFSLTIFDLDSFKAFNDAYGHLAGDELLRQIGSIIKSSIRNVDQAFRYGGDEFAILLPHTEMDPAYWVAERVRKRINLEAKAGFNPVTVSLGLASWPADGIGANEVIAAADIALYHAKRNGGNQSQRFSRTLISSGQTSPGNQAGEDSEVVSTIYAMAATVDARDQTGSHSRKVNQYAVALAEALNLEPLEVSRLSTCAFLHDVGKIGINDEILQKPGKLTDEDWQTIKIHPQLGATIAGHARHLAPCIPGILYHHERYDGTGYPKGLKGEEIPLEARILAMADAFAAMTSERHYSNSLTFGEAVEEIRRGAGTQFDPHLVEVFLSVLQKNGATIRTD